MAQRRCLHTIIRGEKALLPSNTASLHRTSKTLSSLASAISTKALFASKSPLIYSNRCTLWSPYYTRYFSSDPRNEGNKQGDEEEDADEEDVEDEYGEEIDDEAMGESSDEEEVTGSGMEKKSISPEDKEAEAASIGYKVMGPLQTTDKVFKLREEVFAVVQIGSHQFKVSNGDCIFVERLKFCEVNDKLILNKVLLLGSRTQTIIGRPILPDAAVHAIVEEHALDAKVIIFKKKRRKNYRRTKGHRQELTKLVITDIQGIEKPEPKVVWRHRRATPKKQEKEAVAA